METPLCPPQTDEPPGPPASPELSDREVEVLRLVATGVGNKQIAQQLSISPNTVKVHLRNIFAKIGATSRTEAAMYAAREGIVAVPSSVAPQTDVSAASSGLETPLPNGGAAPTPNFLTQLRLRWSWIVIALIALILLSAGGAWLAVQFRPTPPPTPAAPPTALPAAPRWQTLAEMPTARSGLAAVAYDDRVYAIAGESTQGVTGVTERYNPPTNSWETLAPKPVPVTDVSAAVSGGRIFVPGGQLASGEITSTVEAYSPRDNQWHTLAPLPAPVSAYAMVAFEGNLYVFGGWNGENYVASAYKYVPDANAWATLPSMPTARGYLGAAAVAGKIYVIGGTAGAEPLTATEIYQPGEEATADAWQAGPSMPVGRSRMGVASIADIIHVIGGEGPATPLPSLKFLPQKMEWQTFDAPEALPWGGVGLAAANTFLYAVGGMQASQPMTQTWAYEAVYIVSLPFVK